MILKLNLKFIISFIALTFLLGEAHEIVHTTVGRLICGCWGERDFNNWGICESCTTPFALISTLAGPIFTFIVIWIGFFMIKNNKKENSKILGFSLIFACLPFARILNAILGIGDEIMFINKLLDNHSLSWAIGLIGILLITFSPLFLAYKTIENKNKIGWFILFFLVPTILYILLILGIMNTLLSTGILAEDWVLGSPMLVTVWTIFVTIVYLISRKHIYSLAKN